MEEEDGEISRSLIAYISSALFMFIYAVLLWVDILPWYLYVLLFLLTAPFFLCNLWFLFHNLDRVFEVSEIWTKKLYRKLKKVKKKIWQR